MPIKYIGVVTDNLRSLPMRITRQYTSYKAAHDAAERLCARTMGDRGIIGVDEFDVPLGRPHRYGEPTVRVTLSLPESVYAAIPKPQGPTLAADAIKKYGKGDR
jgi:hypothetical protein